MQEEINQLKRKVEELTKQINALSNAQTIPFNTEQAIKKRLRFDTLTPLVTSAKSSTSENQAVDEGGVATYSVMKAPDGFDERNDNGTIKYYPYFT